MRITIDIDGQPTEGAKPASQGSPATPAPSPGNSPASSSAPPEVLEIAATTGAINAGPAPTAVAAPSASAPQAFHSQGAGFSHEEIASATSAGSAQSGKPCG
jgi:hypothetical protein